MPTIQVSDVLSKDLDSFKVQTNGIYDHRGNNSFVSAFGDLVIGRRIDDVSVKFQYGNATYDVNTTVTGTGTVTNSNSKFEVNSGAGIGSARIESNDPIRYRPGHEAFCYFTATFSAADANGFMRYGCFDDDDGFWVGYQGTAFGFATRTGGTDTFVPQTSWNGDQFLTGSFILDPTKLNIYRISYGWLGIAPIQLEVSADNGENWTVAHTVDLRNVQTAVSIENPVLPVAAEVVTTAAPGSPLEVTGASWNGGTVGGAINETSNVDRFHSIDAGTKAIPNNTLTNMLTVRNPATYNGKNNHVKSQLVFVSAVADGGKPVKVTTYKNATVGGTPVFNSVGASSQLQFDVAGTTVSGGTASFPFTVGKDEGIDLYLKDFGLFLAPGDDVTFAVESTQNNDFTLTMRERSFF